MGATDLLSHLHRIGLHLSAEGGTIHVRPKAAITDEARALIRSHKADLLAVLGELFEFAPPDDPESDAEALEERVPLMVEGGMNEVRARQEAVWQADRERCWRAFLRNAQRVLDAPRSKQDTLLDRYEQEARVRYGEATSRDMRRSLESWLRARGVH